MIFDFDDFGANHVISDQCQGHDCRDALDKLHYVNPYFKVTLFAIPALMTLELLEWCEANNSWVELAVHGWKHTSNYEADKWTKEEALEVLRHPMVEQYFVKIFKAPGWQISEGCYEALVEEGWAVADQGYNDNRRPGSLPAYINRDGTFFAYNGDSGTQEVETPAWHGHTWNCVGNGIYETYDQVADLVKNAESFQFVSEVL